MRTATTETGGLTSGKQTVYRFPIHTQRAAFQIGLYTPRRFSGDHSQSDSNEWTMFRDQKPMRFGCTERPTSHKTPPIAYRDGLGSLGIRSSELVIASTDNLLANIKIQKIVTAQLIHA